MGAAMLMLVVGITLIVGVLIALFGTQAVAKGIRERLAHRRPAGGAAPRIADVSPGQTVLVWAPYTKAPDAAKRGLARLGWEIPRTSSKSKNEAEFVYRERALRHGDALRAQRSCCG